MTKGSEIAAVISGVGAVSTAGVGSRALAAALRNGRSPTSEPSGAGGPAEPLVVDFDPNEFLRSPKNYLDRCSELAFAAAELAVRDSGVQLPPELDNPKAGATRPRCGLSFGSALGNLGTLDAV
ncbi:MAG: hypothetical protein KAY32_18335, partial [Candidatus Eisenbacteria sp.]|nr:hypothetical protein [Candidatus Eisenbacteria bacterium]